MTPDQRAKAIGKLIRAYALQDSAIDSMDETQRQIQVLSEALAISVGLLASNGVARTDPVGMARLDDCISVELVAMLSALGRASNAGAKAERNLSKPGLNKTSEEYAFLYESLKPRDWGAMVTADVSLVVHETLTRAGMIGIELGWVASNSGCHHCDPPTLMVSGVVERLGEGDEVLENEAMQLRHLFKLARQYIKRKSTKVRGFGPEAY